MHIKQIEAANFSNESNMTGAQCWAGTVYTSGAPVFTLLEYMCSPPLFVFLDRLFSVKWFADCCKFVLLSFSFGHCFVCTSSIYGFWLLLWYFQRFQNGSLRARYIGECVIIQLSQIWWYIRKRYPWIIIASWFWKGFQNYWMTIYCKQTLNAMVFVQHFEIG